MVWSSVASHRLDLTWLWHDDLQSETFTHFRGRDKHKNSSGVISPLSWARRVSGWWILFHRKQHNCGCLTRAQGKKLSRHSAQWRSIWLLCFTSQRRSATPKIRERVWKKNPLKPRLTNFNLSNSIVVEVSPQREPGRCFLALLAGAQLRRRREATVAEKRDRLGHRNP